MFDLIEKLKKEYPDNWVTEEDEKHIETVGMFAVNPDLWKKQYTFDASDTPETAVSKAIERIFKANPDAKVRTVSVSFSPNFAENNFGGTITISGTF